MDLPVVQERVVSIILYLTRVVSVFFHNGRQDSIDQMFDYLEYSDEVCTQFNNAPKNHIWTVDMCDTEKIRYKIRFSKLYTSISKISLLSYSRVIPVECFNGNYPQMFRCDCGMFRIMKELTILPTTICEYPEIYRLRESYKIQEKLVPFSLQHISAAMFLRNLKHYEPGTAKFILENRTIGKAIGSCEFRFNGSDYFGVSERRTISWCQITNDYSYDDHQLVPHCSCIQRKHEMCSNKTIRYLLKHSCGEINGHLINCALNIWRAQ